MRLGNCNCGKQLDCGCVPYFDTFLTNSVSVLSVGNLVSDSCVFDEYVIDWFHDGEHALVTGKGYDPAIQEFHPFLGDASLPVVGGQWKPVLSYVVVGGIKIYPTPKKCQNWCSNLDVTLPSAEVPYINVINLACGMKGGSAPSFYDFRINYVTTQDFSLATKTIRYFLDGQTGYVAYQFTAAIVADQIEFYYNEENVPLAQYIVGTDLPANNLDVVPEEIDYNMIKSVVNLDGRTFVEGDYLTIKIKPSVKDPNNYNTVWSLDLICLPHGFFLCDEYHAGQRTIDPSTVAIAWNSVDCRYEVSFETIAGFVPGGLFSRYFSLIFMAAANVLSNTALGRYTAYLRKNTQGNTTIAYPTVNYVDMQGVMTATKNGNILTFEFTDESDYADWKSQFATLQNHSHYVQYSEDPLSVFHYKWFYINWRETMISCGDTFTNRTFWCHITSPITFNDGAKRIVVEMLNVTNGLSPIECDTNFDTANAYINATASSIALADFVGSTKCRNANPINLRSQTSFTYNETVVIRNGYFFLISSSLDTVCQCCGWHVVPSLLSRYLFNVYNIRITLTNPDDALNNFRLESQIDVSTGLSTGTWVTVYEKSNGNQIIP